MESRNPPVSAPEPVQLHIDPRRLVWRLATVWVALEIGLLVFDYHVNYGGVHVVGSLRRLANMAREDSLANLAAVLQVALLALTLWAVYLTVPGQRQFKWCRRGWLVLALFFSYITIDDGSRVHERLGTAIEQMMRGSTQASGQRLIDLFPSYTWQIVYLPLFGVLGLFTVIFLWKKLEPEYSRVLIVSGIACFVVAVGMDFLEGLDEQSRYNPYAWMAGQLDISRFTDRRFHETPYDTLLHFSKTLEEAIEMFGTTLIWMAVLRHWAQVTGELRLRFTTGD
jgi:hypothetical protein